MIVMKFGGTSVEDATAIKNLTEIVKKEIPRKPIVAVSACAGITNQLLKTTALAAEGKKDEALQQVDAIEERHKKIVAELMTGEHQQRCFQFIKTHTDELRDLLKGTALVGEAQPRILDATASYGERLSSFIIHNYFEHSRIKSAYVDARTFIVTDDNFTKAAVQFEATEKKLQETILPKVKEGFVVMTQGFIGSTPAGVTTTIGRGGSDYSAAIIGALLNVEDIQIWTDVDGVLTADPSVVKEARRIKIMSFAEAAELAYFGARVLHPETIFPAVKKNIPVRVLNSRNPKSSGTLIVAEPKTDKRAAVKSIAYKEGITLVTMVSTRMFMAYGFLENVFDVFYKYKTVVDTVATSEVSITVTIDNTKNLEQIVKELEQFSSVKVDSKKALVCVVGDNLRNSPGIAAKVFSAISDINIIMISQGASEINISFVINEESIDDAVMKLHKVLFANAKEFPEIFE